MTPLLIIALELLPFAIKIVEKLMEEDIPKSDKRGIAVAGLMKEKECSENAARFAIEAAVAEVKGG